VLTSYSFLLPLFSVPSEKVPLEFCPFGNFSLWNFVPSIVSFFYFILFIPLLYIQKNAKNIRLEKGFRGDPTSLQKSRAFFFIALLV